MNEGTNPATLTKAALRAADRLGLSEMLPDLLGIDAGLASNLTNGARALDPARPEWLAASKFLSIFRSLVTLAGGTESARAWLVSPNQALGAVPADLLRSPVGRDRVLRYLEAVQKHELKLPGWPPAANSR
ncbi:MAG TPA: antitoxin Xre/MbcA/ParS toxin-binding domain-containing protein [Steroidobacteraceae bacterium]